MRKTCYDGRKRTERKREDVRERWIDAARAAAVTGILLGHTQVSIPGVSRFFVLFYVAVFFVLSGYLHHSRAGERFRDYAARRGRRLLVPYFGYSLFLLLFYAAKEAAGGRLSGGGLCRAAFGILYARNRMTPDGAVLLCVWNAPMWFLPALFVTQLALEGLLRLTGRRRTLFYGLCLAGALGVSGAVSALPVLLPWSLDLLPVSVPLAAAGLFLREKGAAAWLRGRPLWQGLLLAAALAAAASGIAWHNGTVNVSLGQMGRFAPAGVAAQLLASLSVMTLVALRPERLPEGLCLIGRYTLEILCLHLFVFLFVQGGLAVLAPGTYESETAAGEALRIGTAVASAALLTIGGLWRDGLREKRKKSA